MTTDPTVLDDPRSRVLVFTVGQLADMLVMARFGPAPSSVEKARTDIMRSLSFEWHRQQKEANHVD